MDFTMRWIQPILSPKSSYFLILLAGAIIISGAAVSTASPFSSLLPNLVSQANKEVKSVASQADYLFKLARKEIRSGNIEKGKSLLQQVLTLDPQHRNAQTELTKLAGTGSSISPAPQAIADSSAAKTDPKNLPSLDSLSSAELIDVAKAMMRDGEYKSAQTTLDNALKKSKNETERRQIRSYLNAISKEQSKFEQARSTQLEYNLSEVDRQLKKCAVYIESGQFDKANDELQKAKQIAPDDKRVTELEKQISKQQGTTQKQQAAAEQKNQTKQISTDMQNAQSVFTEGVNLYKQGQVIDAVQKWNDSLKIFPEHQPSKTYLSNTRFEYEQAIKAKQDAEHLAAEEAKFEKLLDTEIFQYSTQGERVDIKNVISFLSNLSGLNVVMAENLEGKVAFEVKNTTVRGILNLMQKQYGFSWNREKNTVFVKRGFVTKVFPLSQEQYSTIEVILNDPTSLQDSSKNLKSILYGPANEFEVPGKQLYLNSNSRSLVITDADENIQKVEAFLKVMPAITGDKKPVNIGVYKLEKNVSKEIYEMVQIILYGDQGFNDLKDNRRQLFLEQNSFNLIVIDYPENLKKVEDLLSDKQITNKLEEGDLIAKQFTIADTDDVESTPEALARREEFVTSVHEIIRQMLYGKNGVDAAKMQGRISVANPPRGTIDVVDTRQNIRRVEDYLNSIRGETTQDVLIETYPIKHVDVFTMTDALAYLFFDSQQSSRPVSISSQGFQSIGTSEQGDSGGNQLSSVMQQGGGQNRINLQSGGGGGSDLLQFFSIRIYPDANTNSIVVFTPDQEVLDIVTRVINTFDKPQRMLELESRIVSVSLQDLRTINFDYILSNPLSDKISLDPKKSLQNVTMLNSTQPGLNLSVNTLGASRLDFVMSLLEDTNSLNVLSAPRLIYTPGTSFSPNIQVGKQDYYVNDVNYVESTNNNPLNNRYTYTFQRIFAGIQMTFIANILNDDHVYIEMPLNITEPGERLPINIQGNAPANATLPNIGPIILGQSAVITSFRLKNGETAVIGGLIQEKDTQKESRIPIISKIPFLGNMFKDRTIEKTKLSTLVFVTAKIIEPEY